MRTEFSEGFFQFFKTGVFDMRNVWESVWDTMLRKASDTLADMVVDSLFAFDKMQAGADASGKGIFDIFSKLAPGLGKLFGSGSGGLFGGLGKLVSSILPFQQGGIVKRPTLALIGEAGPERLILGQITPQVDLVQIVDHDRVESVVPGDRQAGVVRSLQR